MNSRIINKYNQREKKDNEIIVRVIGEKSGKNSFAFPGKKNLQ